MAFGCVTDPKLYFPKKIGVVAFGCVAHPKTIRSNKDRGNRFWQCHQPENSTLQNNSVMALGCVTNPKTIHSQKRIAFGCVTSPKTIHCKKGRIKRRWLCYQPRPDSRPELPASVSEFFKSTPSPECTRIRQSSHIASQARGLAFFAGKGTLR